MSEKCVWNLVSVSSWGRYLFDSGCGNEFDFNDRDSVESFLYCPYCGKKLKAEVKE